AGYGGDDLSYGVHTADAIVSNVGNENVSLCVHGQTSRRRCFRAERDWEDSQTGSDSRPPIPAIAGAIATRDSKKISGDVVYFDDTIIAGIENEQITILGNSYSSRVD